MIFSQSSDTTLDHQQSIISSGEDSLPDVNHTSVDLLSDSTGTDMVMMTIKNFDFLDNEIEEYEDNFFPQFESRRRSLNESPELEHSQRRSQFGSTPDLKLLGNISGFMSHGQSTDSISLKEETLSCHDEDLSVISTPEESIRQCPTPCASSVIVIQNPDHVERRETSPLTASTHSLHSSCSDDLNELGASSTSTTFPSLHSFMYLMIQSDEVEEIWRQHVNKVISESSVISTINTSRIFPRLYRELRRRLANITKDAYYYISKSDALKNIGAQIFQTLDMMLIHLECPYFYMTQMC